MKRDAAAIIVAAGRGLRFGACLPAGRARQRKQYLLLQGRPLIEWSIRAFAASPSIARIVVVVPLEDVPAIRRRAARLKLRPSLSVVAGGSTRSQSVQNGLRAVGPDLPWIAIHDGVRPLVTTQVIEKTLQQARRYGAAIAACRSKDTVKLASGNECIGTTPRRDTVWLAQTPQIFKRSLLEQAHRRNADHEVTDDAQLVERLGRRVKLVESSPENLKVTIPSDLAIAQMLVKNR